MPQKFVFVPWGADCAGDSVWLLENALVFEVETVFEKMGLSYADLYEQLGGSDKRTSIVTPASANDLLTLASRAPEGTSGIVDGLINVIRDPATASVVAIEAAPRILELPSHEFRLPDAFRFEAFSTVDSADAWFVLDDQEAWHTLALMVTESILQPFGLAIPPNIGPETLQITGSWQAYCAFIKAKRGAKTVDEKLGYYRQASRHDPAFFWARYNAGQLLKQQQDYHSARREFLIAAEAAGDDPGYCGDTYFELGLCSIFLGDTKTARNFWDQALIYSPNNPVLLVNVAGTYEQEEDWESAIKLHHAALEVNPEYYKAIVSLARLKAQTGLIEEAIPLYEKALKIEPNDPLRYAILGGCYLAQGDKEKAIEYFETASSMDPLGKKRDITIDDAGEMPSPGEYARQELKKIEHEKPKDRTDKGGWRWFGR